MTKVWTTKQRADREKAKRFRLDLVVITGDESFRDVFITCQGCGLNDKCEFAWDHYNTDGDCLAEK
jgi:hypothetical protein